MNVLRGQNRLVLGGSLHWIFHSTYFELYDALQAFSDIRSVGIANLDQNEVRVRQGYHTYQMLYRACHILVQDEVHPLTFYFFRNIPK